MSCNRALRLRLKPFVQELVVPCDVRAIQLMRQPGGDLREYQQQGDGDQLQQDKGCHTTVNLPGGDARRRHAAQVKQRESKGRREKTGLQVDRNNHGQPDRVHVHHQQDRRGDWQYDKDDFHRIEHKAEQEHQQHHKQNGTQGAAGQGVEKAADQLVAAEHAKHQGKYRGAQG